MAANLNLQDHEEGNADEEWSQATLLEDTDDFYPMIFALIEKYNNVDRGFQIINQKAKSFKDLTGRNSKNGFTILHYTCSYLNSELARKVGKRVITSVMRYEHTNEALEHFMGALNNKTETCFEIALENNHYRLFRYLLVIAKNNNLSVAKKCYGEFSKKRMKLYKSDVELVTDSQDLPKYLWNVKFNFGNIIGKRQNHRNGQESFRETKSLDILFDLPLEYHKAIFSEPLLYTFVSVKSKQYWLPVWISIAYHIFWSLIAANFLLGALQKLNDTVCPTNATNKLLTDTFPDSKIVSGTLKNDRSHQSFSYPIHGLRLVLFLTLFAVSLIKEGLEACYSPTWLFYYRTFENYGKCYLLFACSIAAILPLEELFSYSFKFKVLLYIFYSLGLAISLLLIQVQFSKSEFFGVHNQMMTQSFVSLLKFLFTFSPILMFNIYLLSELMPMEYSLDYGIGVVRVFAMLTGDFSYRDVFSDKNPNSVVNTNCDAHSRLSIIPTVIVFGLFIFMVAVLLQNLLIALSVSNLQELERDAAICHAAAQLEVIILVERFVMSETVQAFLHRWSLKNCVNQYLSLRNIDCEHIEGQPIMHEIGFTKLPRSVQETIMERKF